MTRNFVRRVEVMVPVEDPVIRLRLLDEVLGIGFRDDAKAMELQSDGTYSPVRSEDGPTIRSQMLFLERAHRAEAGKEAVIRHIAAPEPTPPARIGRAAGLKAHAPAQDKSHLRGGLCPPCTPRATL